MLCLLVACVFISQTQKRSHDKAFNYDDDDDWIFNAALDDSMTQIGGGGATTSNDRLLDFQLRPVSAHRNWRNVLNKQRFEATLQQHRDITPNDNLGEELTHALRRSIERQIASNPFLTPHCTVHFCHAVQYLHPRLPIHHLQGRSGNPTLPRTPGG